MSLFPVNETPKPRALGMLILGLVLFAAGVVMAVYGMPGVVLTLPGGILTGWFGMEYFVGKGPSNH